MTLNWQLTTQEADDLEAALETGASAEVEGYPGEGARIAARNQRVRIGLLLHRFQKARVEQCPR